MSKQKSNKGRAKAQDKAAVAGTPLRSKKPGFLKYVTKEGLAAHIKEEYEAGKSTAGLAKELGCTAARVGEIMEEAGIPRRKAKKDA